MNTETSQRRHWQRIVSMGLGRQLTKAEAKYVADTWREYRTSLKSGAPFRRFPPLLVIELLLNPGSWR